MKLIIRSFALALVVSLVACKKDDKNDNNPSTNNNTFLGVWSMTEINQSTVTKVNGNNYSTTNVTGDSFTGTLEFKSDNTFEGDLAYRATMITDMGFFTDTTVVNLDGFQSQGTWKVTSSGDLEITSNGETDVIEVASSSANKLVLKMNMEQTDSQGGINTVVTTNVDFTLEK